MCFLFFKIVFAIQIQYLIFWPIESSVMCDITSELGGDAGEGDSAIGIDLNLVKMIWLNGGCGGQSIWG